MKKALLFGEENKWPIQWAEDEEGTTGNISDLIKEQEELYGMMGKSLRCEQ